MSSLQVRRGSEPALNRLSPIPNASSDPCKRWSAAVFNEDQGPLASTPISNDYSELSHEVEVLPDITRFGREKSAFQRFSRDTGRLSILGNNAETFRWVDAADRQLFRYQSQESGLDNSDQDLNSILRYPIKSYQEDEESEPEESIVILKNQRGPLGIHVVPDYDSLGRETGLLVQGIEPGGRIDRDGHIKVLDRIVEINGRSLLFVNFQRAQEIFRDALQTSETRLRVAKGNEYHPVGKRPPPPVLPKQQTQQQEVDINGRSDSENQGDKRLVSKTTSVSSAESAASSLSRNPNSVLVSNTRKIGKKFNIQLTKGPDGLGFSVTTRDNPAGGNCPIYIKNILPKGAAIIDGRLRPGDRLLEVNSIEMTGKSQAEAVNILRNVQMGAVVTLVVSRQEVESPRLPREIGRDNSAEENQLISSKHKEVKTFDIPLNDTGSAGLGVSVKGKTSTSSKGTIDLGIFVKSVITGGAASKDGRLRENDQLVNVNGVSLLGKTNSQAMETLRRAIQQEGPNPNAITLTVARRISGSRSENVPSLLKRRTGSVSSDNRSSTPDTNSTSEHSDGTIIFQPLLTRREEHDQNINSFHESIRKIEDKDLGLDVPLRNPVIERLTGQKSSQQPRNESYYRATQDWTPSPVKSCNPTSYGDETGSRLRRMGSLLSPTVNLTLDDTMIIEDDYTGFPYEKTNTKQNEPIGLIVVPDKSKSHDPPPQDEATTTHRMSVESNTTYSSQMSLEEAANNFARDGFGRQSISEKRHAHIDAKNTDTYQRNKKAREEREKQRQQFHKQTGTSNRAQSETVGNVLVRANSTDSVLSAVRANRVTSHNVLKNVVGPVLGMKKSSSLESLQTMVAEAAQEEDRDVFVRPSVKAIRGRGCNESFRAAVDRSYDAQGPANTMETLDEDSESGSSGIGRGNSRHSSVTGDLVSDEIYRYSKKGKKKSLLKGLGHVFKFGKQRKLGADQIHRLTMEDLEKQKLEAEKQRAKKAAQDEQERIKEQYHKLQRQMEQQKQSQSYQPFTTNNNTKLPKEYPLDIRQSRQERMNQLRAHHQRQHQERHGHYTDDGGENKVEEHFYNQLDRQDPTRYSFQVLSTSSPIHRRALSQTHSQRYDSEVFHSRSRSYDQYKEKERPVVGKEEIPVPSKYSHYANYEEIQQHMRKQAAMNLMKHTRPVSKYYEYESIQAGNPPAHVSETNTNSLPRRSHRQHHHHHPQPQPHHYHQQYSKDRPQQHHQQKNHQPEMSHTHYVYHPHSRAVSRTNEVIVPNPLQQQPVSFIPAQTGFRPPGQFVSTSRRHGVNRFRDAATAGSQV